MTPRFLTGCEAFQPAEQACWEVLLREFPGVEQASAEEVRAAIACSLAQLWSLVRSGSVSKWLRRAPPEAKLAWLKPGCGLETVFQYFAAGRRAVQLVVAELDATFPEVEAEQRKARDAEIELAFGVLVQREIQALCGRCGLADGCTIAGFAAATRKRAVKKAKRKRKPANR